MRRILVVFVLSAASCARAPVATPAGPKTSTAIPVTETCQSAVDERGTPVATAIDWRGPDDPADRAWLLARCLAVGPAVIDATPAADLVPPDSTDVLTIVSWNTHVGGGDLRAFIAGLRSGALTGGEAVGHFVIFLQEVIRQGRDVPAVLPAGAVAAKRLSASPPSGPRQDVVTAASSHGLALYYVPQTRNGRDDVEDRGNAMISTLPLSGFIAVELPSERLRRVAIAARIGGPGAGLRVATAHLDVVGGPSRLWILGSSELRNQQARALVAALDDGRPIVLGGDFNTWADATSEPAVATLRAAWPDASLRKLDSTFFYGLLRLDYFFFRLGDAWRGDWHVGGSMYGSDHRPLVARLARSGRPLR